MAAPNLATVLKRWRDDLGKTQAEFASYLAQLRGAPVTQAQICKWENGGPMSPGNRASLARVSGGRIAAPLKSARVRPSPRRSA